MKRQYETELSRQRLSKRMTTALNDKKQKQRTANSGFKKLAVQWLNEHLCFESSAVLADSFVLRNRQLLKPAKRWNKLGGIKQL